MKKQLYLLLLSSCIFIVIITLLQVNENSKRASYRSSDCFTYEQAAQYLYDEGFKPHPLRPMLYPLIVGIPKLFTTNYEVFLNFNYVLNVTFWLFTILFIYKSIHLLLKPKATLILTLLFVVNISNISLNFQLLTEPIYTFLLSLVMFLVAKFFISRNINHLTSAVGLLVLSILIRPTGLYLAALVQYLRQSLFIIKIYYV